MIYLSGKAQTKRGNTYNTRSSRIANGYSKVLADREKNHKGFPEKDNYAGKTKILLSLAVRGTTDILGRFRFSIKGVVKHHPIDSDYTKRVLVLNDMGKRKLSRLKFKRGV